MRIRVLLAATLVLLPALGLAQPRVQVVGLFPGAAVLTVDGQRKLVRVGQTGPGGVQVVSVDGQGARLRVDGVERHYPLGREYSAGFAAPTATSVSIARGAGGHYWVAGSIDGHVTQFLVDTGATSVAMNEAHARRLGLDYRTQGRRITVNTASGTARAWSLRLDSVKVGAIEVLGVDAVVIEGGAPSEMLLGMSFLNRVRWREEQGTLRLESRL